MDPVIFLPQDRANRQSSHTSNGKHRLDDDRTTKQDAKRIADDRHNRKHGILKRVFVDYDELAQSLPPAPS